MANEYVKIRSTVLVLREPQIKTIIIFHQSDLQENLKSESTKCLVKISASHKLLINLFKGSMAIASRSDSVLIRQPTALPLSA